MKTVTNFVKSTSNFNALMLKIGDMMEVTDDCAYKGHVLLCVFNGVVNLTEPKTTWLSTRCTLEGRKLLPGESVTLIQE